jgi:hypothetical protein
MPLLDLEPRSAQAHATRHLQAGVDQIAAAGGGLVRLLPGTHETGSVRLKSGVRVELTPGATWQACADPAEFVYHQSSVPSRMDVVPWRVFIYADGAEDIALYGGGTLEGGGAHPCFFGRFDNDPTRPYGLFFINCEGVRVTGLKMRNSAFWMQRYLGCRNVFLRGLDIYNHCNQNNDGIDVDSSRDVVISDCIVDASDDAICLKSEGAAPAENIVISNCIIATHASGFKLGSGSVGGFRNIVASGLVMRRSRSKVMCHPLQCWGGLTAIDIGCIDGGPLDGLHISDVLLEGYECPMIIKQGKRLSGSVARQGYASGGDGRQGINQLATVQGAGLPVTESKFFQDVTVSNLVGRDLGPYPIIVTGYPGAPLGRVLLRDVRLAHRVAPPADQVGLPTRYDDAAYTGPTMFGTHFPAHGLFTREAPGLVCHDFVSVPYPGDRRPDRYDCGVS